MSKTPISAFDYFLPESLIAQYPVSKRDFSKLLVLKKQHLEEFIFNEIVKLFNEEDFLVVNNTRVFKGRLFGNKATGGKVEILLTEDLGGNRFKCLIGGRIRQGDVVNIGGYSCAVEEITEDLRTVVFSHNPYEIMEKYGHVPLPPYIKRVDQPEDAVRYQTVYSKDSSGGCSSVAAPTAGLHFTDELLERLKDRGVEILDITLNVGIGTFKPVKSEFLEDHKMHTEKFFISKHTADRINSLKKMGKKLTAVGTTTVRVLESVAKNDGFIDYSGSGETDIFIFPGYKFKTVDKLITNFHLPKSTLLALVCAFGGYENVMNAYKFAIDRGFRFFSYGDAMFLEKF